MKNLIFYNCHRHTEEIYYSSLFFNRSTFLKNNFNVHLHCNNINHTFTDLKKFAKFDSLVDITITSKNSGYYSGVAEAHSNCFELFKDYELVIISQIDCYIVNDTDLIKNLNYNFDVLVSPMFHLKKLCYAGDFFVIRPKYNFLSSWKKQLLDKPNPIHEHFLYETITNSKLNILEFNRYSSNNMLPHHSLDDFGLWHEHDNLKIKNYLNL